MKSEMDQILRSDLSLLTFRYLSKYQDGGPFRDVTTRQNDKITVFQFFLMETNKTSFSKQCFRCNDGDCVAFFGGGGVGGWPELWRG